MNGKYNNIGRTSGSYKAGDLVSYDAGDLVYIGRKYNQVKLQSYKVDLGEVEHHGRACSPGSYMIRAMYFALP